MKSTRLTPICFAIALGLGTLLTACGEDKKPAQATDANAAAPADASVAQEIIIGNGAEPESLDPHKVAGVPESNILRQMLVGLVSVDDNGKTIPGMATEWSSPDNKVWTFKLRDAKWSNGDPVTAEDFVFSFRRLVDPMTASPYSSYLVDAHFANAQDIVDGKAKPETLGVKAIDEKTLEITLSEPVPYLPDVMFHTSVKPVNPRVVKELGDKWTSVGNYVVNGPYKPVDWVVNERIVLERNPEYFDNDKTTINKITFLAIEAGAAEVSRYKAHELDITSTVPPEQYKTLKAELGDQVQTTPSLCTYYYEFNHTKAPFNDVRVRKALALTVDREVITDNILGQGQQPAYQYTPKITNGIKDFNPEWQSWDKAKRAAEAKRLLNEAGFNESNPLTFELLHNTSESHKQIAVAVSQFWKENIGFVNVTLNNQEWKTYLETRRQQKFDIARGGWCADYNEPSTFLNTFKSKNSNNNGKYNNPEFDAVLAKTLGGDVTPEQRADLYTQAEAILDKDAATIFVYHYTDNRLVSPTVKGLTTTDPLFQWEVKNLSKVAGN
ncbi:ABC transporter substrate-binding protein [Moraxella sp.]|uniref:ABC transporter substrate-binding protein n=1 Tax=Moraxella sp. TaxID=479 RepID=UPI0026DCC0CE|nr:ABC transporter substrate-binding protein [Moraxella sp.]MDO4894036.1 ABC transporter substrate-binding protein [Moraxella sp.]